MSKIALVHEWFTALAGSERVVEQFCGLYPDADLFAIYAEQEVVARTEYLRDRRLRTSFIKHLPGTAQHFRSYLLLMPLAVEQFDLSSYDLVISSSHAAAKGVLTGPDQLHISYVHTPIRYAWDLQHQYLRESGLDNGFKGWLAKWMLHKMRIWDYRTAAGVDHFVANSHYIARRIQKVYGRHADVVYPPVDVAGFSPTEKKDDFYLAASRLVPYKRMDLIVRAFAAMPERRLIVIGDGPERDKLAAHATPNVELLGYQPLPVLKDMLERARAFVFAAEEDFGIIPVEAQAAGTPVIALGKGGALETVNGLDSAKPTGVFFEHQEVADLIQAVKTFERHEGRCTAANCRENALRFSVARFRREFASYVAQRRDEFNAPRWQHEPWPAAVGAGE
jgi:glycosyltransferase involved in cell wall biosynthesis